MNNDELFEEQIEQTEQLTEESSNPTEDVIERPDNRDEAERDTDRESELLELSAPEITHVTKQCIYVSLEHLKPFSGTLSMMRKAISVLSLEIRS